MRTLALAWTLVAMVIVLVAGCGGGTTTSSTSPDPDVNAAKEDMLLAYRVANTARLQGLRCSVSPPPGCQHPRWYPSVGTVVAEVGSEKSHRLTVVFADSTDQVVDPGVTYIVKARRKSLVLAQKSSGGTILVLHGSPSGSTFTQVPTSSSTVSSSSTTTVARPTVSVPDVRGMSLSAAERKLENARLGWSYGYQPGQSPPGSRIVRDQDPSPGSRLYEWKPVELKYRRR
jgi:hypothetical protein